MSAAHCLHTVTEDNPELLRSMNTAVLGALEHVLLSSQPGMAHTLLRTLAAGTVCPQSFCFSFPRTAQNCSVNIHVGYLCVVMISP